MARSQLSVVIPSLDRKKELTECLASLNVQTCTPFEIIILTAPGSLACLRNQGWQQASGDVVAFLDDDVVCASTWVSGLLAAFQDPSIMGVSGPSPIPRDYQRNRDLYAYPYCRKLHDYLFVGPETRPGYLTQAGTFVPEPIWTYEGPVEFLQACNMAFRKTSLQAVGGFDEAYGGIGDWSEPDLCFRIRQRFGDQCLRFTSAMRVEHRPSRHGAYRLRRKVGSRLVNYQLFARRWVAPSWQHLLYHGFLRLYYTWKTIASCFP